MTKQRTIRRTLLAIALAALGANGTALADPERFASPTPLVFTEGSAQGWSRISNDWGVDVHYYSFVVNAGDVVTLDIDGPDLDQLDSVLYVFDPMGRRRYGGDAATKDTNPADSGSRITMGAAATVDAFVRFTADMTGSWTVAVAAEPAELTDRGVWLNQSAGSGGEYNLFVTRSGPAAPPEAQSIKIDIKPGDRHDPTPIYKRKGHIRVALLADSQFDPFAIDESSLRFGPTGTEAVVVRCSSRRKDVNRDHKRDRVCRFDNARTGFTQRDEVGIVKGTTKGGKAFEGSAKVKVLQQKHHKDRKHHDDDDDD